MDQVQNIKVREGVVCCPRCGGGTFERDQDAATRERVILHDPDDRGQFDIERISVVNDDPLSAAVYRCSDCRIDFTTLDQLARTIAIEPNAETIATVRGRLANNRWAENKRYLVIALDGTDDWCLVGACDSLGEARRAINDGDVDRSPEYIVDLYADPDEALYLVKLRVEEVLGPNSVL